MNKDNRCVAIIVAAGSGTRMKKSVPKPYMKLAGKPLFWYSMKTFQQSKYIDEIYMVVSLNQLHLAEQYMKGFKKQFPMFRSLIIGGKQRTDSVFNALKFIQTISGECHVAIHDAARPFLKPALLERIVKEALKSGSAAPALTMIDTIKICDKNRCITKHLQRDCLAAIQTPQVFPIAQLLHAYHKVAYSDQVFSDDTEVYQTSQKPVQLIDGDSDLFKITFPEDIQKATAIYKRIKQLWK